MDATGLRGQGKSDTNDMIHNMGIDNDRASVRVVDVDDGKTLTTDEVRTLKRIEAMSKFVQWIVLFLASLMMFVGVDHLIEFLKRLSK
jgi:hypothetical protein